MWESFRTALRSRSATAFAAAVVPVLRSPLSAALSAISVAPAPAGRGARVPLVLPDQPTPVLFRRP